MQQHNINTSVVFTKSPPCLLQFQCTVIPEEAVSVDKGIFSWSRSDEPILTKYCLSTYYSLFYNPCLLSPYILLAHFSHLLHILHQMLYYVLFNVVL